MRGILYFPYFMLQSWEIHLELPQLFVVVTNSSSIVSDSLVRWIREKHLNRLTQFYQFCASLFEFTCLQHQCSLVFSLLWNKLKWLAEPLGVRPVVSHWARERRLGKRMAVRVGYVASSVSKHFIHRSKVMTSTQLFIQ